MNTPFTATHVFYVPDSLTIIDTCTDEKPPRSHIGGKTLKEIRKEYPGAIYTEFETASKAIDNAARKPVTKTTKEHFWEMLEVLPPVGWKHGTLCESFKMSERFCGNITDIYARIGDQYFTLRDDIRLSHEEIIRRCKEFNS